MSNEWGRENETEYLNLIFTFVLIICGLFVLSAGLSACARHQWPEIGENVRVEKITIRECKKGEC